jgi:hypothetical protein
MFIESESYKAAGFCGGGPSDVHDEAFPDHLTHDAIQSPRTSIRAHHNRIHPLSALFHDGDCFRRHDVDCECSFSTL